MKLTTARLELIAGSADLVHAEMHDPLQFAALLKARVPDNWPPEGNDAESQSFFLQNLTGHSEREGWLCWYMIAVDDQTGRTAVGGCGFKGMPSAEGEVEIGYAVLQQHQRRGYASEAVLALLGWVFEFDGVHCVVAETVHDNTASIAVLQKCGFTRVDEQPTSGALKFSLNRADHQSHSNSRTE
jgi:ribosomal-protein-alanine N-acetyltransferase